MRRVVALGLIAVIAFGAVALLAPVKAGGGGPCVLCPPKECPPCYAPEPDTCLTCGGCKRIKGCHP